MQNTVADSKLMRRWTLALPDQLEQGFAAAAVLPRRAVKCASVVVCGMGGSGISGALAASLLWDRLGIPIVAWHDYDLPAWVVESSLVIGISYSGGTEETISALKQADRRRCRVVVIAAGGPLAEAAVKKNWSLLRVPAGPPPRAALGYLLGACLGVFDRTGLAPRLASEVKSAVAILHARRRQLERRAVTVARFLHPALPVVYSASRSLDAVADRWRAQLNENSKLLCHTNQLPELDHNEIVGLGAPPAVAAARVVVLVDSETHPRTLRRVRETLDVVKNACGGFRVVSATERLRLGRMLELVMVGDLASLKLAAMRGVNPRSIDRIDELKRRLESVR